MTEQEWLACSNPRGMLEFAQDKRWESTRKLRLFTVACCRRGWDLLRNDEYRRLIEVLEHFADGLATEEAFHDALHAMYMTEFGISAEADEGCGYREDEAGEFAFVIADLVADHCEFSGDATRSRSAESVEQARLFRDIFQPFRIDTTAPVVKSSVVADLAQAIYTERVFDRLPILADALEEAGCTDEAILSHCRGPGPHVRGCWVVDLILGKE